MQVHTVGIMFDDPASGAFPTLDEISSSNYCNTYSMDVDVLVRERWVAIAYDPRGLMYGDEDTEAMDETNLAALVDAMGVDLTEIPRVRNDMDTHYQWHTVNVDAARDAGIAFIDGCLIVAPYGAYEDEYFVSIAADCKRALEDYPLLDESAYSEREWQAWQEYAPDALGDEIREARRDETVDDETLDRVESLADDLLPILAAHLHYESGFSGEYDPPFLTILADLIAADDLALLDAWNPLRARTLRENVQQSFAGC